MTGGTTPITYAIPRTYKSDRGGMSLKGSKHEFLRDPKPSGGYYVKPGRRGFIFEYENTKNKKFVIEVKEFDFVSSESYELLLFQKDGNYVLRLREGSLDEDAPIAYEGELTAVR